MFNIIYFLKDIIMFDLNEGCKVTRLSLSLDQVIFNILSSTTKNLMRPGTFNGFIFFQLYTLLVRNESALIVQESVCYM